MSSGPPLELVPKWQKEEAKEKEEEEEEDNNKKNAVALPSLGVG